MSIEKSGDSGGGEEKQQGGRRWLDRLIFFALGNVTGAGGVIAYGLGNGTITAEDLPGGGSKASSTERSAA